MSFLEGTRVLPPPTRLDHLWYTLLVPVRPSLFGETGETNMFYLKLHIKTFVKLILLHIRYSKKLILTMEIWDMNENTTENVEAPSNLPRLFIAPSCLPKFSIILATVRDMKAELLKKTIEVEKLEREDRVEQLKTECFWTQLKINGLENEAREMRKELVGRIYVEARSVNEMKAVNELRLGVGAGSTPGMRCFRGKIYVPESVPRDLVRAMEIVERKQQTYSTIINGWRDETVYERF
ncbi:hypothetical protein OSB04_015969 [Centaurea solstitialis]|uniref:Uncharacterized protein n=1 Tax=Centaurea solstitialis TaxID=347529 RepID=A0AA38T017_9ASTR|nr:hypothetical protein OSB04_015969 [Centaurea solstitialis]